VSTWLSPAEVAELTGLKPNSWRAQARRLAAMGVPFRLNGVGRPLVERAAVCKASASAAKKPKGPNWEALNGQAA
jgi:hypothetical protein